MTDIPISCGGPSNHHCVVCLWDCRGLDADGAKDRLQGVT